MGNANLLELTEHHLYPKTHRRNVRHNKVMVPRGVHQAWHTLVAIEPPEGAIVTIVQHFLPFEEVRIVDVATQNWEAKIQPLRHKFAISPKKARAFELVFPTQRPLEILKLWAWQWAPRDYVRRLAVVIGQDEHSIPPDSPDPDLIARIKHRQECKLLELQSSRQFHV